MSDELVQERKPKSERNRVKKEIVKKEKSEPYNVRSTLPPCPREKKSVEEKIMYKCI